MVNKLKNWAVKKLTGLDINDINWLMTAGSHLARYTEACLQEGLRPKKYELAAPHYPWFYINVLKSTVLSYSSELTNIYFPQ